MIWRNTIVILKPKFFNSRFSEERTFLTTMNTLKVRRRLYRECATTHTIFQSFDALLPLWSSMMLLYRRTFLSLLWHTNRLRRNSILYFILKLKESG